MSAIPHSTLRVRAATAAAAAAVPLRRSRRPLRGALLLAPLPLSAVHKLVAAREWKRHRLDAAGRGDEADRVVAAACARMGKRRAEFEAFLSYDDAHDAGE